MARLESDITAPLRDFDLNLKIEVDTETVALVGPSGAGKSTVLRCLAGLHRPAAGRIALDDVTWFDSVRAIDLPAERRSIGLVFQDYALFPHMSVHENVAYGMRKRSAAAVDELLERMGIASLADERPGRLSGGERQRVALARALARSPALLALDEPLSALDAFTRTRVREQLVEVIAAAAIPTLIVTHDFTDAAALADRVGVIRAGRLGQLGTPEELLERPADEFVASLVGSNLLGGIAEPDGRGGATVSLDDGDQITIRSIEPGRGRVGVTIHPWQIEISDQPPEPGSECNAVPGVIGAATLHGSKRRVRIGALLAETDRPQTRGQRCWAVFEPAAVRLVTAQED